jgi:hypothetical protein
VTLKVRQSSDYQGGEWWKWSVWLEGSAKELAAIDRVVYTLHPTFPDPVQTVKDRRTGFKLESSGWGEFEIYLQIVDKKGKARKRRHWLSLAHPAKATRGKESPLESAKAPVAYVSSTAATGPVARKLREALSDRGFKVLSMEDLPPGLPWEKAVDEMLGSADVAVFLLSGRPSLWTQSEIELALTHKVRHLVPVVVGEAEIPRGLENVEALRIDSPDQVEPLAKTILGTTGRSG